MKLNFLVFFVALLQITNAQFIVTMICFEALAEELGISAIVVSVIEGLGGTGAVDMVAFEYEGQEVMLRGAQAAQVASGYVTRLGGSVGGAEALVDLPAAIRTGLGEQYAIRGVNVQSAKLFIEHSQLGKQAASSVKFLGGSSKYVKATTGMNTHIT